MKYSYRAVFKPAGNAYGLSNSFANNGVKQYATLYHTALSTRTVRITRVHTILLDTNGITIPRLEVIRLTSTTAPATGNPIITPTPMNSAFPSAESVALALPSTAGSEGGSFTTALWQLGNTGNNTDANLIQGPMVIYEYVPTVGTEPITLRKGVAEGIAIKVQCSLGVIVLLEAMIEFTEE